MNVLATLPCGHIRHLFINSQTYGNKKDVGELSLRAYP